MSSQNGERLAAESSKDWFVAVLLSVSFSCVNNFKKIILVIPTGLEPATLSLGN